MSKYEERAYNVGRTKPNIAGMKNQLARLKHDLEQFTARKPDGAVVVTLRERIREFEATIAEAEANKKRDNMPPPVDDAADDAPTQSSDRPSAGRTGNFSTSSQFPPRGRPGR
ncbi:MAG: Gas vesicle protein V [Rhodospirillaceae bacterium]